MVQLVKMAKQLTHQKRKLTPLGLGRKDGREELCGGACLCSQH